MIKKLVIKCGIFSLKDKHQHTTKCINHLADSAKFKGVTFNIICVSLKGSCFQSPNDTIHVTRYKLLGILRDKILFLKAIEISISTTPKIIPAKKSLKLNPVVGVIFSLREWFSSFKASRV